jgi:uncharacterized protein
MRAPMSRSPSHPRPEGAERVLVRASGVHGRGLFARQSFSKGERIIEYVGNRVTKAQSNAITTKQWEQGRVYTFELNSRVDLDGSPMWNTARWANHSCDPNAETEIVRGRIWLVAKKKIAPGDEITYDYNFPLDDDLAPCRCGSSKCLGYIVGRQHASRLRKRLAAGELPKKK